jgi:hypothetical protein
VIEYIINLGPSRSIHVVEEFLMRLSESWKNALINPAAWIFSSIKVGELAAPACAWCTQRSHRVP